MSHFLLTVDLDGTDPEVLSVELWGHGAIGVEELPGVLRAAFTDESTARQARAALGTRAAAIEPVADTHGLDAARDLLRVEVAGPFAVHPPWLEPPPDLVGVEIDPGHAFGSGSHASTRLALELLGDELPAPRRVFDVGCGSGVLAIAAAHLGATATAVDIDPAAITATEANAERNGVADRVTTRQGSADALRRTTDLVTINVTIDVHETLAPTLHACHRRLIVAGLLGRSQLERGAIAYGATEERVLEDDGWMAAVLTRS